LGKDDAVTKGCLRDFKIDIDILDKLGKMDSRPAAVQNKWVRHLLRTVSNKQYVEAVREVGFEVPVHPDLLDLVNKRSTGAFTTNIDEEIVGITKNFAEAKAASRYRRPELSMGRVLGSKLLEQRFDYDFVEADSAIQHNGVRLPDTAFKQAKGGWSLPFDQVQGTSPACKWHSPSATNLPSNITDLFLLRDLDTLGDFSLAKFAFLGKLFQQKHSFVYQHADPATKKKQWTFPIKHWHESAVFALPVVMHTAPGGSKYFELACGEAPVFLSIVALSSASSVAARVVPRSWAWQFATVPSLRKKPPSIRLFMEGSVESVLKVACRNAFWLLPKTDIEVFADYFSIFLPKGLSLVEVLTKVIKDTLKCNDQELFEYLGKRLSNLDNETVFSEALLDIDEAMEVVDRVDQEAFVARQKTAAELLHEKESFAKEYGEAKFKVTKRTGGKNAFDKMVKRALPLKFAQSEVKSFLPPSSHCWKGNTRGEWWCHVQPYSRRIVVRLSSFGNDETKCIAAMLQRAWVLYLEKEGRPRSDCPIEGLFAGEAFLDVA
jgi:hypothetical protein